MSPAADRPAPAPLVADPLLADPELDQLRRAFADFTVDGVHELLGPIGRAAQSRGDLAGMARAVRAADADDHRLAVLVRLFLLAAEVSEADARAALDPLPLSAAGGLLELSAGAARARLDVRPYGEADGAGDAAAPWWVFSDFGSDVRPGPLTGDHVLGIGAAALTLAQATPRDPVARALDVGIGCGVQALHLGRHAGSVTATDISPRALRLAATTAALSGQSWELLRGSFLEPVAGRQYDLVVANPPFVVSPGTGEHDYRDSGLPGDEVCRSLVGRLPDVLAPGGTAQLLANWIVPTDGDWRERVDGWIPPGCDAWVWQREVADLGEYVALWLRDAGHVPGRGDWTARYDAWTDWFVAQGVAAIGMGLITVWRADGASRPAVRVLEDVPQAVVQPVGAEIGGWIGRQRWLADRSDDALLRETLHADPELVRTRRDLLDVGSSGGWQTRHATLRQSRGMRWEVEADDAVGALVAACDAGAPAGVALELLQAVGADGGAGSGAEAGHDALDVAALAPVLRDLVGRGVLRPGARP